MGRLLSIYQKILDHHYILTNESREQIELLLSGLVAETSGNIEVKNRIYKEIFNRQAIPFNGVKTIFSSI